MELPCKNCTFPLSKQPCEPTIEMWRKWRETPAGLLASSFAGECQQRRKNAGEVRDPLTGIDAKALMLTKLLRRFNRLAEHPIRKNEQQIDCNGNVVSPAVLTFIDGDGFGGFNKQFNQRVGDGAIIDLAAVIQSSIREGDYAARIGGDEFVTAMFGFSRENALRKMIRMRNVLQRGGSTEYVDWSATIVGAYIENPEGITQVQETFDHLSDVVGDWKLSDRTVPPPLLIEMTPGEEPRILA